MLSGEFCQHQYRRFTRSEQGFFFLQMYAEVTHIFTHACLSLKTFTASPTQAVYSNVNHKAG